MKATDLLVTAECVKTGERLIGYVCSCKSCRTPFPDEKYDHTRPIGLLTHPGSFASFFALPLRRDYIIFILQLIKRNPVPVLGRKKREK